ncbi:hypothetical protein BC938DRAFT_473543 [Jimgerdemannia flammicorona]|uniref:RRM domain-containing protein n=1 Tax=Jimgerdemannia flammicorona TaxID=994334 RepID=A0A433Q3R7_9FUNG|nr:hypothetical protein BC938DRAFT_473543 [Jimgerdemannia flammicorona]
MANASDPHQASSDPPTHEPSPPTPSSQPSDLPVPASIPAHKNSDEETSNQPSNPPQAREEERLRRTVHVSNLDYSVDYVLLKRFLSHEVGSVRYCQIACRDGYSRGFAYVEFDHPEDATRALETGGGMRLLGRPIVFGAVHPRPYYNDPYRFHRYVPAAPSWNEPFTNLYVQNVPRSTTDQEFSALFERHGPLERCVVKREGGAVGSDTIWGFVNYVHAKDAKKALQILNGRHFKDRNIMVQIAKSRTPNTPNPPSRQQMHRRFPLPTHNYPVAPTTSSHSHSHSNLPPTHPAATYSVPSTTSPPVPPPPSSTNPCNVYVKNLDPDVFIHDADLRDFYSGYGGVVSARIMRWGNMGQQEEEEGLSRGFGFVLFEQAEQAAKAVAETEGMVVGRKSLMVNYAEKKEDRQRKLRAIYGPDTRSFHPLNTHHPDTYSQAPHTSALVATIDAPTDAQYHAAHHPPPFPYMFGYNPYVYASAHGYYPAPPTSNSDGGFDHAHHNPYAYALSMNTNLIHPMIIPPGVFQEYVGGHVSPFPFYGWAQNQHQHQHQHHHQHGHVQVFPDAFSSPRGEPIDNANGRHDANGHRDASAAVIEAENTTEGTGKALADITVTNGEEVSRGVGKACSVAAAAESRGTGNRRGKKVEGAEGVGTREKENGDVHAAVNTPNTTSTTQTHGKKRRGANNNNNKDAHRDAENMPPSTPASSCTSVSASTNPTKSTQDTRSEGFPNGHANSENLRNSFDAPRGGRRFPRFGGRGGHGGSPRAVPHGGCEWSEGGGRMPAREGDRESIEFSLAKGEKKMSRQGYGKEAEGQRRQAGSGKRGLDEPAVKEQSEEKCSSNGSPATVA